MFHDHCAPFLLLVFMEYGKQADDSTIVSGRLPVTVFRASVAHYIFMELHQDARRMSSCSAATRGQVPVGVAID